MQSTKDFVNGLPRNDNFCFKRELTWREMFVAANYNIDALAVAIVARCAGRRLPSALSIARAIYGVHA